jgi:hypothetical protein
MVETRPGQWSGVETIKYGVFVSGATHGTHVYVTRSSTRAEIETTKICVADSRIVER